jgi:hypothetical protein
MTVFEDISAEAIDFCRLSLLLAAESLTKKTASTTQSLYIF